MIQSSDQDILDEFDKLPYHIQYKITEFFKEFFSEILLFDSTVHTINPSSLNSFYDINFDPNFLIKGNRHLRGNKLRGLDVAMYTQTRTQTVAEMRAVLDLFIYKLKRRPAVSCDDSIKFYLLKIVEMAYNAEIF